MYSNKPYTPDHLAIAKLLQSRKFKRPWVVSYDNAEEICTMYSMSQGLRYALNYTAQRRYAGSAVWLLAQMAVHGRQYVFA